MISSAINLEEKLKLVLDKNLPKISGDIQQRVPAAVLVPFVSADGEWQLLFTKRTNGLAKHQGEISFPGGAAEEGDGDLIDTAVRETCEEIGICKDQIKVIGVMEPVPTVSNYCVLPVIAIVSWPQPLKLNPTEVDNILLIPVDWLRQENNWYRQDFNYTPGKTKPILHYKDFNGEHLWGITAGLAQKITDML
jgi:8-oxo-dGTP pyrophosphatase MutT (NUDIX family)